MTLPVERTWAVLQTRDWLVKLLTDRKPLTKCQVRAKARQLLKHYPSIFDMEAPAKAFDAVIPAPEPSKVGFGLAQPKHEGRIHNLRPRLASMV